MILAHKQSLPSARILRDVIKELSGIKLLVTTDPERIKTKKLHLRYGNSDGDFRYDTDYNSRRFIQLCSRKWKTASRLKDLGVWTVDFIGCHRKPEDYPVLVRTTLSSFGGKGIHLCRNPEEFSKFRNSEYVYTPFVKTDFELRLHILGNSLYRVFKKIKESSEEEKYPIRNLSNGYHFSLRKLEKYPRVDELVKKLAVIDGAFFAVDVGWSRETKKYIVFELNSAPGLNINSANGYAKFLLSEEIL